MKIILILLLFTSVARADFIIFSNASTDDNVSEFEALVDKLNSSLGYPNNKGTVRYAIPIVHPTEDMIAIKIIGNIKNLHLSISEKGKVVTELDSSWDEAEVYEDTKKIPEKKI